ncbi:NAD/NADP octopine/nopaline dehydrogenase family protein [Rhypophila decipiens]
MAPENLTVGLLGFGHANAAMAGYFASKGISTMVYGLADGEILITEARSLQDLVRNTRFMILSTRVDAHSFYVDELRKHNSLLGKSMLFVMTGAGFTLTYGRDLNFQYVLECSTAPNTAKLDDSGPAAAVHLKSMKLEFELSWFPNASQDRTPARLNIAFACVGTGVHLPTALLNIGRLPDEARLLTPLAKANLAKLPTLDSGYFYGNGMNTYVNRCQLGLDRERLAIAAACGLKAGPTLLEYLNGFYGTSFKNLREFSSNPYPHNAQKSTPKDMGHRYYCEEYISLTLLMTIARLVGEPAVLFPIR